MQEEVVSTLDDFVDVVEVVASLRLVLPPALHQSEAVLERRAVPRGLEPRPGPPLEIHQSVEFLAFLAGERALYAFELVFQIVLGQCSLSEVAGALPGAARLPARGHQAQQC
jgi:hypothetical protein